MTLGTKSIRMLTKKDYIFYVKMVIASFLGAFIMILIFMGLDDLTRVWDALPIALIVAIVVATFLNMFYLRNRGKVYKVKRKK